MQCSNVSGIVGRGKTLFFSHSGLGQEIKINTRIPLALGSAILIPS